MRGADGRDHLCRFLPGDEWKKLPKCFKAPNRGRRLKPRLSVVIECRHCGKEAKRHRRSARYCSDECQRRAWLERDALREGKPLPTERIRGEARRRLAIERGICKLGSRVEYERQLAEKERKAEPVEPRSRATVSPQEEWMNYHRCGLAFQDKSHVIRYARVFRPQTAR